MSPVSLHDLPADILHLIFPYLDLASFLSLISTCTQLHKPEFLYEHAFWSGLARNTLRIANQPVISADGRRWYRLCKRLLTQSRVFTWGDGRHHCLGNGLESIGETYGAFVPRSERNWFFPPWSQSWPRPIKEFQGLGVVSDVQCGGWSTTLLTAKGGLYTMGVLDAEIVYRRLSPLHRQKEMVHPTPLQYPPGFPPPHDRYEPSTAIKQFSAGRNHVLALSDSGRIWSWSDIEQSAYNVKFLDHDIIESKNSDRSGAVKRVVAGWSKSAALIQGVGILLWERIIEDPSDAAIEDTALILESALVLNPEYHNKPLRQNPRTFQKDRHESLDMHSIGNFIVLEHLVIFNTDSGRVYAARIDWENKYHRVSPPTELPLVVADTDFAGNVTDVQGSFRSFAIFAGPGAVLTSSQDRVEHYLAGTLDEALFDRIQALQNTNVVQVAFGDHHFHALHSQGHITSYGSEPKACGALGLGGCADIEGRLRGIQYLAPWRDGKLLPHAYAVGRRLWFEPEKRAWLKFLASGGVDDVESAMRQDMAISLVDSRCQGEVSEWIEQQGRDWESKYGIQNDEDDLGIHFALSISAAGWHSAALVLVNQDLAAKLKQACEVPQPEPERLESIPASQASTRESQGLVDWAVNSAVSTAVNICRWFLGLPSQAPAVGEGRQGGFISTREILPPGALTHRPEPIKYGASPRVGFKHAWADDHFPRLVLSDGREMPGIAPFDQWRYPRPEWKLRE